MIKLREDVKYDLLFIDFLENILESTIILFENCIFCALKKEKNHNQEDVFQWSLRAKNKTKQTKKPELFVDTLSSNKFKDTNQ